MEIIQQKYSKLYADTLITNSQFDIIAFSKSDGIGIGKHIFNQMYLCEFSDDEHTYTCAEQYMMYQKAKLFNDEEISLKILNTSDPVDMKSLGRQIKNFDANKWDNYKYTVVYTGNYLKFSQNEIFKAYLKSTNKAIIVDASINDTIWGIGLDESDENIKFVDNWKGENLLGFILMQVRDNI